ncbi:MAG: tyrosinase family protein [Acidobacteria bacterium]|nr:tyrosinase family protein [Acidobacteriota bacterium]
MDAGQSPRFHPSGSHRRTHHHGLLDGEGPVVGQGVRHAPRQRGVHAAHAETSRALHPQRAEGRDALLGARAGGPEQGHPAQAAPGRRLPAPGPAADGRPQLDQADRPALHPLRAVQYGQHPLQLAVPAVAPRSAVLRRARHAQARQDGRHAAGLLGLGQQPNFDIFGGTAKQRTPVPATFSGPHANVHNAFSPGDMADLQYSPRDPVFYAHHGNIDRLWSSWVAAGHKNPDFGTAKVYFYDENRVWSYVLFNDLRDEAKLGYNYSSLMKPTVKLSSLSNRPIVEKNGQLEVPPTKESLLPKFLVLQNVHLEKQAANAVDFGVFFTQPPVGTATANDKANGFLGTVNRVLSSGHDHHADPLSAVLEVDNKLDQVKGPLKLYVAPLDPTGKTTAAAAPLSAEAFSLISE